MPAPKESVGDRSDAGVFGGTKETSTDADFFHETKERMDQKKETMNYRGFADARKHVNHNAQWIRSRNSYQQDSRGRGYVQNLVSGIKREFRVVKDNRLNQNAKDEVREVKTEGSHSGNEQKLSVIPDKIVASDQTARHSDGYIQSAGLKKISEGATKLKAADSSDSKRLVDEETNATIFTSKRRSSESNSMAHSNPSSSNSVIGVHSSFSDPVHVPSPISRSAGKVGAIRRELGVVGGRRQSSDHSANHLSVSSSSFPTSISRKDISLEAQASNQPDNTSKSNVLDQMVVQVPILHNATSIKSVQGSYHNSKLHQSSGFQQKANQSNMEWKPKSVQKPTNSLSAVGRKNSTATSHTDDCGNSNAVDTGELCSQISAARNLHVIIPQHLQMPDLERLKLTFGSFGAESDSTDDFSSTFQEAGNTKSFADGPSISTSASGVNTMAFSVDSFVADRGVILNDQARPFQLGSSASTTVSEELGPGLGGTITSENIERYDEIGLVQSNSHPYNLSKGHQFQNNPSLPNFSEQPVQPQQPVAQVYPQVHIPQYPNFVPFCHFFSPVYVPPMAVSNYTGNPAYSLSSTGNSYVMMPRGNSHINVGSMKFTNPQYKPIASVSPTAYGHYSNPTGFSISPGTVGMVTGLEDMTRHKFKDNNPYVPNPQVETSDMWIQTPQELTSLQSSYYNLPGQAPHVGFMPVHASHAAFNAAAQPSHQHHPGLYHTQPPSMASPHHTMHQHVPSSFGGGIGVGVAAPGPQVGAYQQPQVSNFNWTTNF